MLLSEDQGRLLERDSLWYLKGLEIIQWEENYKRHLVRVSRHQGAEGAHTPGSEQWDAGNSVPQDVAIEGEASLGGPQGLYVQSISSYICRRVESTFPRTRNADFRKLGLRTD